jgi:regulator of sirC expression with transglutaminase-like and TPR domain
MTDRAGAVLALLEDPDPQVRASVQQHLASDPALFDVVWMAATAAGQPSDTLAELAVQADAQALADAYAACEDLEAGLWLLSRLGRPRIDHAAAGRTAIDALAARLAPTTPLEAARGLADLGFIGDRSTYDDPANSMLDQVLERRVGLPLTLVALWVLVCRRCGLPAWAVALPGHVVGGHSAGFVDCFAGGADIGRSRLDRIAQAAGEQGAGPWLAPAEPRGLLRRAARNLVLSYLRRGDRVRAAISSALAAS